MIAHLVCPSLDHYDVPLALGRRLLHHVCTAAHHDAVPGRCVAPLELLKEAIHVAELRRTVGVYHQHELPACTQHALAHGATFAVVPEKLEQSHGVCAVLLDVALHHRACAVSTAVVDDDNLVREATEGGKWWVGVGDGVRRGGGEGGTKVEVDVCELGVEPGWALRITTFGNDTDRAQRNAVTTRDDLVDAQSL